MEDQELIVDRLRPEPLPSGAADLGQGVEIKEETGHSGKSVLCCLAVDADVVEVQAAQTGHDRPGARDHPLPDRHFRRVPRHKRPEQGQRGLHLRAAATIDFVREENGERVWGLHVLGYKSEIDHGNDGPQLRRRPGAGDPDQLLGQGVRVRDLRLHPVRSPPVWASPRPGSRSSSSAPTGSARTCTAA